MASKSAGASAATRASPTNAAASSTTPATSDRMMTAPVACAAAVAKNARVSMRRFLFLFFQCGSGNWQRTCNVEPPASRHSARSRARSPAAVFAGRNAQFAGARAAHRAKTVSRTSTPRKLRSLRTAAAATHHSPSPQPTSTTSGFDVSSRCCQAPQRCAKSQNCGFSGLSCFGTAPSRRRPRRPRLRGCGVVAAGTSTALCYARRQCHWCCAVLISACTFSSARATRAVAAVISS